jgi:putative transposase
VRAFRREAPGVAADQWSRFFETGRVAKNIPAAEEARVPALRCAKATLGAARLQMLRWQVVGQLEGFLENRANDFRDAVTGSSIPDDVRHQLLVVNRLRGWFSKAPIVMRGKEDPIDPDIRRLARAIMRGVLSRHRKPSWRCLHLWLDARAVTLGNAKDATHAPLWLEVATLERVKTKSGKPGTAYATVALPVGDYAFWRSRDAAGPRATTVQIIDRGATGAGCGLLIGVVTDMEEAFAASRAACAPLRDELALDFGLATMFATPDGDLLGRAWFDQMKRQDARINGLARKLQKQGIRPNRPPRRYRDRVAAFRGFLKTEIGRVLNRIVALKRPAHVTIEKLDFTAPGSLPAAEPHPRALLPQGRARQAPRPRGALRDHPSGGEPGLFLADLLERLLRLCREDQPQEPGAIRLPRLRPQDPCRRERGAQSGERTFRFRSERAPHEGG